MKINTLEYIHRLLFAASESENTAYRAARDLLEEMESRRLTLGDPYELDAIKSGITNQKAYIDECWKKRCAASAALEDFENQEW